MNCLECFSYPTESVPQRAFVGRAHSLPDSLDRTAVSPLLVRKPEWGGAGGFPRGLWVWGSITHTESALVFHKWEGRGVSFLDGRGTIFTVILTYTNSQDMSGCGRGNH